MRLLQAMRDNDYGDGELIGEKGVWCVGLKRFKWKTVQSCLILCLIRCEQGPEHKGVELYSLNEDGNGVLDSPTYKPKIIDAIAKRA